MDLLKIMEMSLAIENRKLNGPEFVKMFNLRR